MGVPKFYRWISERYPCLSTVAREYQLPEFDNLYLDMNGIIHVCSHPNDTDAHFRISEAEIFANIFDYIDFIFRMVKPKKVFFMAVDGVAPRAKMNQQRDRRFRSAKDAELIEKEAKKKGEDLPREKRFDSNSISPGTEFMERLHEQLKYFVVRKLSEDPVWQKEGLNIYLSGHDVPGEGEHKAMDFIRYIRSQPGYDANTRHCIYGQDADLIMLALCTHEPHIALLREEVVFGKKGQSKRIQSADKVTFHLLHISLLREYLDHEFSELRNQISFEYNLENIIDDWLLMCFLVGNDFIPHLPNLHIAHDALPILHRTYMSVMPKLDGYLHQGGELNLKNFEVFLRKLGERDHELFVDLKDDKKYMQSKSRAAREEETQRKFKNDIQEVKKKFAGLDIPSSDEETDGYDISHEEFRQHKRHYYMTKMNYHEVDAEVLREQAHGYVRALQWNLHYYYNGVQSWSWYYPHHYSPYISDICNFSDANFQFEMGHAFLPFQQLLSIMPSASKELVPAAYRDLMTDPNSPLKEYFPDDFDTDLNGKTQEWEAVVLIKYIEEDILLNSMKKYDNLLTEDEKARNQHGCHLRYCYSAQPTGSYPSPLQGHPGFPSISLSHAICKEIPKDTFRIPRHSITKGRLPNTKLSLYFPGFPTLKHIPHKAILSKEGVQVFQQPSRGFNMMIDITNGRKEMPPLNRAASLVNRIIHIDYPHLRQALVTKVSDGKSMASADGIKPLSEIDAKLFIMQTDEQQRKLHTRWGIETGPDNNKLLVYCKPMVGRKYVYQGGDQVTIKNEWADQEMPVLDMATVCDLQEYQSDVATFKTVTDVFPIGKMLFVMDSENYGTYARIEKHIGSGSMIVHCNFRDEPDFQKIREMEPSLRRNNYLPAHRVAREIGIESHLVARLTGCIKIQLNSTEADAASTVNVGFNLKFNKKNEEVPGYSKRIKTKEGRTEWRFSSATTEALREFLTKFETFFRKLRTCIEMDQVPLEKIYPGPAFPEGLKIVREVAQWIKDQPFSKAGRQKCGAIFLDEGVVAAIEEEVNKSLAVPQREMMIRVNVENTYMPGLQVGLFAPDARAQFRLYDRVVSVREDITIPLGLKGTIIAYQKPDEGENVDNREATYDVLFDEEFISGQTIKGASGPRVASLSMVSMINISHGMRMKQEREEMEEAVRKGHGAWQDPNSNKIQKLFGAPNSSGDVQERPRNSHENRKQGDRHRPVDGNSAKKHVNNNNHNNNNNNNTATTPQTVVIPSLLKHEPKTDCPSFNTSAPVVETGSSDRTWFPESSQWLEQTTLNDKLFGDTGECARGVNGRKYGDMQVLNNISGVCVRKGRNRRQNVHKPRYQNNTNFATQQGIPLSVEDLLKGSVVPSTNNQPGAPYFNHASNSAFSQPGSSSHPLALHAQPPDNAGAQILSMLIKNPPHSENSSHDRGVKIDPLELFKMNNPCEPTVLPPPVYSAPPQHFVPPKVPPTQSKVHQQPPAQSKVHQPANIPISMIPSQVLINHRRPAAPAPSTIPPAASQRNNNQSVKNNFSSSMKQCTGSTTHHVVNAQSENGTQRSPAQTNQTTRGQGPRRSRGSRICANFSRTQ